MNIENEIWKDIPEYEGQYQVSNFGRVKSLERKGTYNRIMKPHKCKNGYLYVCLSKDNKYKTFLLHRLVALAFIPNNNPTKKTQINHKDENKENNKVENLEWVTPKENTNYGTRNERASKNISKAMKEKYKGGKHPMFGKMKSENHPMFGKHHSKETKQKISENCKGKNNKPIQQYTLDNVFIREWESATTASEELNIIRQNITNCCKSKQKSAGGFIWRYKDVA